MGETKFRATTFRIDAVEKQPGDRIKVRGHLTRTGAFEYRLGEETITELRTDAEVFSADSLSTLEGAYVTIDHPRVPPKDVAVGRVLSVTSDPPYVSGVLQVEDARTAKMIENGHLKEISCGYLMALEESDSGDGSFIQTNIRYDHAALLPVGDGRLGRDVCLRLDSNGNQEVIYMTDEKPTPEEEARKVVDSLSKHMEKLAEGQTEIVKLLTTQREDAKEKESAVVTFEELPSDEQIEAIVEKRVDSVLTLELRARAAHRVFFPKDYVKGERCAHELAERVLQRRDSRLTVDSKADVAPFVEKIELLAQEELCRREDARQSTSKLKETLGRGVPVSALQTSSGGLRSRILGKN